MTLPPQSSGKGSGETSIPFSIVNSFTVADGATGRQIGGNGAAVIFMEGPAALSDSMQIEIAKRFPELTEAVFVYPSDGVSADIGMRYWSPQRLCEYRITGHPTIAAAYSMLEHNHPSFAVERDLFRLETKAGIVELRLDRSQNKVYMGQIEPEFQDIPRELEPELTEMFGLSPGEIISPIKAVNMGLGYLIFKVKDLDVLTRMTRDLDRLIEINKRLGLNGGAQPFADNPDERYHLRTRNLDLRPFDANGVWLEDSACGQGSASVMAYLMKYLGHPGAPTRMEQGVLTEPCCVEASGEQRSGSFAIFIGGSGREREQGTVAI